MADIRSPLPVLLVIATFSRHSQALDWARAELEREFGPVGLAGSLFDFVQTKYYEPTMGSGLKKQLLAFESLVDPDCLPRVKHITNRLEQRYTEIGGHAEARPLNLDPGLLAQGKFMLATTKDQGHRIYLRDGIFAEVTLRFEAGQFTPWPWTYADYRLPEVLAFLGEARDFYRNRLAERADA
jgi:hypothetical protein